MGSNTYLLIICSAVYATLSALIVVQARRNTSIVLASACGLTAVWAAYEAVLPDAILAGPAGLLDLGRLLGWYTYLLHLYKRSEAGPAWHIRSFAFIAFVVLALGVCGLFVEGRHSSFALTSLPISIRLAICIVELLLIENLYLNLPENARWHVALPCVLLGSLACFDILVNADTSLFRRPSIPLTNARVIAMIIIAPLLVLASSRGQRWTKPVRLSRAAVFHSATLVLSGSVLLSLVLAGEVLRQVDVTWGWVAELSFVFSGVIGLLLYLSSKTAKGFMERVVLHNFFADRYDYRIQWLGCIRTLSGKDTNERSSLHTRAIRAVANVVNSPNGALFLRETATGSMTWAGSWNMPATTSFLQTHPLVQLLTNERQVVDLRQPACEYVQTDPLCQMMPVWLAVPLLSSVGVNGLVVVGPPRISFETDQEVLDLLGIIGQEVGTYVAEQHANEAVFQTRNLHEYGKRFAFVAHDIKNVSSQLALLLSNAEHHIANPAFQLDMLETVSLSVEKIDKLLRRLDEPATETLLSATITPVPRLEALLATYQRIRTVCLTLEHDGSTANVAIAPDAFDTAITHILNNAVEAAPLHPVLVRVEHGVERVVIEIKDRGRGMSPEFVRDELFSPFKTSKAGGSGIGAFQARELIRQAGGEIFVVTQIDVGTTVRVLLRRTDYPHSPAIRVVTNASEI